MGIRHENKNFVSEANEDEFGSQKPDQGEEVKTGFPEGMILTKFGEQSLSSKDASGEETGRMKVESGETHLRNRKNIQNSRWTDGQSRGKCDRQGKRPRTDPERSRGRPGRDSRGRQLRRLRLRKGHSGLRSPACKHVEEWVSRSRCQGVGPGATLEGARAGRARTHELSVGPTAPPYALS